MKLSFSYFFKSFALIFIIMVVQGCSSQQGSNSGWQMEFTPGTADYYAAVHMLSSATGKYHQLYAFEGKWNKNPNIPSPPSTVTKGNVKMQYLLPTSATLAGLNIYSATTGEWEQFYLKSNEWIKNPNFPQPKISINKGNLDMKFIPGSNELLPGMIVTCSKTQQMEILYLENGEWKTNTSFPAGTQLN